MAPINRITRQDVEHWGLFTNHGRNLLDYYQEIATKSAVYPGQGSALGLLYCALKLNGEAGELAEHVGKAMRDDALMFSVNAHSGEHGPNNLCATGQLTPERYALIVKEVGDQLWYLSSICNELGIRLSDAAGGNLAKLCDRGERDVLQGSGDER